MTDQCKSCTCRGNLKKCMETECYQHENWFVKELKKQVAHEKECYNPHWIGDEVCRDYKIGNITLYDVPDSFVLRSTDFMGPYGFAKGNTDEFLNKSKIAIPFDMTWYRPY